MRSNKRRRGYRAIFKGSKVSRRAEHQQNQHITKSMGRTLLVPIGDKPAHEHTTPIDINTRPTPIPQKIEPSIQPVPVSQQLHFKKPEHLDVDEEEEEDLHSQEEQVEPIEAVKETAIVAADQAAAQVAGDVTDVEESVALKTVDLLSDVSLLYSLVEPKYEAFCQSNHGFPQGYHYKFPGVHVDTGADYCSVVFSWIESELKDRETFPEKESEAFTSSFMKETVPKICTRICRVFAIMYNHCMNEVKELGALPLLNACFKNYFFFVRRFRLVKKREFEPFRRDSVTEFIDVEALEKEYHEQKHS